MVCPIDSPFRASPYARAAPIVLKIHFEESRPSYRCQLTGEARSLIKVIRLGN